jgi:hypothetical protein
VKVAQFKAGAMLNGQRFLNNDANVVAIILTSFVYKNYNKNTAVEFDVLGSGH